MRVALDMLFRGNIPIGKETKLNGEASLEFESILKLLQKDPDFCLTDLDTEDVEKLETLKTFFVPVDNQMPLLEELAKKLQAKIEEDELDEQNEELGTEIMFTLNPFGAEGPQTSFKEVSFKVEEVEGIESLAVVNNEPEVQKVAEQSNSSHHQRVFEVGTVTTGEPRVSLGETSGTPTTMQQPREARNMEISMPIVDLQETEVTKVNNPIQQDALRIDPYPNHFRFNVADDGQKGEVEEFNSTPVLVGESEVVITEFISTRETRIEPSDLKTSTDTESQTILELEVQPKQKFPTLIQTAEEELRVTDFGGEENLSEVARIEQPEQPTTVIIGEDITRITHSSFREVEQELPEIAIKNSVRDLQLESMEFEDEGSQQKLAETALDAIISIATQKKIKTPNTAKTIKVQLETKSEQSDVEVGDEPGGVVGQHFQEIVPELVSEVNEQPNEARESDFQVQLRDELVSDVQRMSLTTEGSEFGEIRIELKPESLGELKVKVVIEQGVVSAELMAESVAVKEVLAAQLNQLRSSLQDMGMNVAKLTVNVSSGDTQFQGKSPREPEVHRSHKLVRLGKKLQPLVSSGSMIYTNKARLDFGETSIDYRV